MKQNIIISGLTCEGCVSSVSKILMDGGSVKGVQIDLKTGNAALEVENPISLDQLRSVLPPKYTLSLDRENDLLQAKVESSKIKQLFPLFLIFTYLIAGSLLLQKNNLRITGIMFNFMGLFFIIFSFFKFLDYKAFPVAFAQYDPLAKRSVLYSKIYPFLESVLGIMFLIRWSLNTALVITIIILSITTVGVIFSLFDKSKINCACLGTALKLPMTKATLIENFIMFYERLTKHMLKNLYRKSDAVINIDKKHRLKSIKFN